MDYTVHGVKKNWAQLSDFTKERILFHNLHFSIDTEIEHFLHAMYCYFYFLKKCLALLRTWFVHFFLLICINSLKVKKILFVYIHKMIFTLLLNINFSILVVKSIIFQIFCFSFYKIKFFNPLVKATQETFLCASIVTRFTHTVFIYFNSLISPYNCQFYFYFYYE